MLSRLKISNQPKILVPIAVIIIIALIIGSAILWKKDEEGQGPENQRLVYEALVNIVDQKASDPVEDARSSFKKGDVIAYFPEGHSWSDTEKYSYLIVKLSLKPEDAEKLLEAETREVDIVKDSEEKDMEPPADAKAMGPQTETIRARKYFLDLPGFDVQKFWETQKQPFADKIFTASIIDKK